MDKRISHKGPDTDFIGGGHKSNVEGDGLQRPCKGINIGYKQQPQKTEIALTIQCAVAKGTMNQKQTYVQENKTNKERIRNKSGAQGLSDQRIMSNSTNSRGGGRMPEIAIPVLTPDREKKRQNGRRFKEDGDPAFTLTAQDRHGVYNGHRIRRLTPKECFRLQGWTDDYFEKAQLVNSDSQLYKQAGNGVTVTVIKAIADKMKEGD